jgi:G3E family GTPase
MTPKPVHIITGFLGAGKTTFLNYFIKQRLSERIFVIENEYGATNVDGGLVMGGVEEVVELTAGCLCCSLADGLLDILEDAWKRRDQYDRLVIETTGIADPTSIIETFLNNERVEQAFELKQVICLADGKEVENWLDETDEALRQIVASDVILLNKVDMVTEARLEEVTQLLENINPQARILSGQQGQFSISSIFEMGTTAPMPIEQRAASSKHHHHKHGEGNNHSITTFTLTFDHPLDLNELQLDLNRIVNLYRDQVYRVKGFIAIPSYPNRVILQSARSTFIATDGTPWEDMNNRQGKLVFIGRNLKKADFEEMFNKHMRVYNPPSF